MQIAESSDGVWKRIALFLFRKTFFKCYIAGETEAEALEMAKILHRSGFGVISGILGEEVRDKESAKRFAQRYLQHIRSLKALRRDDCTMRLGIALKFSSFGMKFDKALALRLVTLVVQEALYNKIQIEIDMEGPETMDDTMEIVHSLMMNPFIRNRAVGSDAPRLALPANQAKSYQCLEMCKTLGLKVRIVKGAYPGDLIHRRDINTSFLDLVRLAVGDGIDTVMGTHDKRNVIRKVWPKGYMVKLEGLFGVRMFYQEALARRGYRNYIYMPWGTAEDAMHYLMRRAKEGIRPSVCALFFINMIESLLWRRRRVN